ncbi:hypothetical protein [Ureibacillus chungkukjangi]|uniref:Uncharacterized protein n=1 Tax=Ureibacillus chungkukjangi TaxID=1202712 RepID=A0A318TR21_9BACL|nr:hypothetical protein [Ureibacillus chungkukjangi]MCM3388470.1 hypothetical protein [Ureibacillus chungkukjangi]PYF07282.1 hypothetical protein BJ095_10572 [Ureibacillus chungkukjangi]
MFNLYTKLSGMLVALGIILVIASFYINFSIWYGIEIAKCGGALFIMFLFLQLLSEHESEKSNRSIAK